MPLKTASFRTFRLARALVAPWWKTWFNNERETIGVTPWTTRFWTTTQRQIWICPEATHHKKHTWRCRVSFGTSGSGELPQSCRFTSKILLQIERANPKQYYDVQKSTPQRTPWHELWNGHVLNIQTNAQWSEIPCISRTKNWISISLLSIKKMLNMCESWFYQWIFFSNVKGSINHIKSGHFCLACWVSRAVPCSKSIQVPPINALNLVSFRFFSCLAFKIFKLRALNACKHRGNHKISNVKLQMDSRFWESNISVCNQTNDRTWTKRKNKRTCSGQTILKRNM